MLFFRSPPCVLSIPLPMIYSFAILALALFHGVAAQAPIARLSPAFNYEFQNPLPIPPTKSPLATYTNPKTGVPIDFYEVKITPFTKKFFPNLEDASMVGQRRVVRSFRSSI